jgi:CheY-like chemotaxis protein
MGAIVTEASEGSEGLNMVNSQDFDLIITDIEMPRMDGFTFFKQLKSHPTKSSIPVIILSSKEKEEDIEFGFKVGAASHMTKSNASNLRARVKEILDSTHTSEGKKGPRRRRLASYLQSYRESPDKGRISYGLRGEWPKGPGVD